MKTIGEELSRMSEKYDQSRSELNEARKKYMSLQRENQSMNQEMESASQIIAEIMEQFERKKREYRAQTAAAGIQTAADDSEEGKIRE